MGYIGFTSKTVEKRMASHYKAVNRKDQEHYTFYRALKKYSDKLVVTTLVEGSDEYCLEIERKLRPEPDIAWNISCGGGAPMLGRKHSEEGKQRIAEGGKGRVMSDFNKQQLSKANKGKIVSEETRKKQSEYARNRPPETRLKMSEAQKGKKHTEESKAKMSAQRMGNKNCIGYKHSDETKQKQSEKRKLWQNSRANTEVWLRALELYSVFQSESTGCGKDRMCTLLNEPNSTKYTTVCKQFKRGWIPSEDESFMKWLSEQKENNVS